MKTIEAMLRAHPDVVLNKLDPTVRTLESLGRCEQICFSCADACLGEDFFDQLRSCIRINLDCAAICSATAQVILRQTDTSGAVLHAQLHACTLVCQSCADLCATHGRHHEHCKICAEACRDCQEKCNLLLGIVSNVGVVGYD